MSRKIEGGWLREYLKYTENHESPVAFHAWVGLSVIAAALERRVYLDFGYYKTYPNIYVVLISDPGLCKKSAAIGIGSEILSSLARPPKQFAQKGSPEALIRDMRGGADVDETVISFEPSCVFIKASELSTFLGKASYESGLLALLTDLYDSPDTWTYQTVSKGKQELHKVYVNLLGGTTPSWLSHSIPGDAMGGGFLSRTIMVFSNSPKKLIPWPEIDNSLAEIKDRLVHDLEHLRNLKGPMIATQEAKNWYSDWYEKEMEFLQNTNTGEIFARRPTQLLKVAMLLSVSDRDDLVIDVEHLEAGTALLDSVRRTMDYAIEGITIDGNNENLVRVLKVIQRHVKISHKQLQRTVWRYAQADALAAMIATLKDAGLIRVHDGAKDRWYEYLGDENPEETLRSFSESE